MVLYSGGFSKLFLSANVHGSRGDLAEGLRRHGMQEWEWEGCGEAATELLVPLREQSWSGPVQGCGRNEKNRRLEDLKNPRILECPVFIASAPHHERNITNPIQSNPIQSNLSASIQSEERRERTTGDGWMLWEALAFRQTVDTGYWHSTLWPYKKNYHMTCTMAIKPSLATWLRQWEEA
eukprot:scaffold1616_cov310-Pinguiococcus_pyrenoidosus.AAC.29